MDITQRERAFMQAQERHIAELLRRVGVLEDYAANLIHLVTVAKALPTEYMHSHPFNGVDICLGGELKEALQNLQLTTTEISNDHNTTSNQVPASNDVQSVDVPLPEW